MGRIALLATTMALCGMLPGCSGSGYWDYLGDTFSLPGANPNRPAGTSETYRRVRAKDVGAPTPLLTQAGDVWPGPPEAVPTLKDLQRQQNEMLSGPVANRGSSGVTPAMPELQPLPNLPGYEVTPPATPKTPPANSFPTGVVPLSGGASVSTGAGRVTTPGGDGSIVVPNGNGTSTVISPTGAVTTIPTPGK